MIEDPDVIFVDFDELFENGAFDEVLEGPQYDDAALLKLLEDIPKDLREPALSASGGSQKRKRGPQPKAMTREQFYKIRPKMPRISKADPRRSYAAGFAAAYNSCDFDKIWEYVSTHCTKDVLFIHRWVGSEQYLNFPSYLEIRGIESVAEYWFSRCVIVPDLVVELKETKLFVRSDGLSTVLSSFTIVCTRLYDGIVSDSLICRPAIDSDLASGANSEMKDSGEMLDSDGTRSRSNTTTTNADEVKPELINSRVMEKLEYILMRCEPVDPKKISIVPAKRKFSEDATSTESMLSAASQPKSSPPPPPPAADAPPRKRMPLDTAITLLGTVTLHINKDQKIRQIELTFALKQ